MGCVLQPVVTPPIGGKSSRHVLCYRKNGAVRQRELETARGNGHVFPTRGGLGEGEMLP